MVTKYSKKNNYVFMISVSFCIVSCLKIDCENLKIAKESEECIIVVEEPPTKGAWFKTKGYNPYTKDVCECKSSNRWWDQFSQEIEVGDTIIKKKGELTFNIHKKDRVITHHWVCEGKTY